MSPSTCAELPAALSNCFLELPANLLDSAAANDLDLYWMPSGQDQPSLIASSKLGVDASKAAEIAGERGSALLVRRGDFESCSAKLIQSLEEQVADGDLPTEKRFSVLQQVVSLEVQTSMRSLDNAQFLNVSEKIADQVTDMVADSTISPLALFELAQHDITTFVHATNVTAYAVMLADALGYDRKESKQIALGAMLHDIGKRSLPREILTKPKRLTAKERQTMQKHPTYGYIELQERPEITHGQLMMAYQHHEWINGGGYPVGVLADEIHPWAKLLAVVDVFDAMTANRPYRLGVKPAEALKQLVAGSQTQFDPEIVKCWISLFLRNSPKTFGTP